MESRVGTPRSVGSHPHGELGGSVGRGDGNIQVVANLELLRLQREGVFRTLPPRHCVSDVLHPGIKNPPGDGDVEQDNREAVHSLLFCHLADTFILLRFVIFEENLGVRGMLRKDARYR